MSRKTNGVNYGKTVPQKGRRRNVIERLETQLKSELKMEKGRTDGHKIPLTDSDIVRIKREIATLKERI